MGKIGRSTPDAIQMCDTALNPSSQKNRLRIGTVPFYNALPLTWTLPNCLAEAGLDAEISEWLPSSMRAGLISGELDLALMPVAELASSTTDELEIIGNACIGCHGKVESVLLVSRVDISQIKTLALDVASRSSVTLSRIILKRFYGVEPILIPLPLDSVLNDCEADAFVVIGDRALYHTWSLSNSSSCFVQRDNRSVVNADYTGDYKWHHQYDLGELWLQKTGLPFVFAAWIIVSNRFRDTETTNKIIAALDAARNTGVANIAEIVNEKEQLLISSGSQLLVDTETLKRYLSDSIHYFLGSEERKGLNTFLQWCRTT